MRKIKINGISIHFIGKGKLKLKQQEALQKQQFVVTERFAKHQNHNYSKKLNLMFNICLQNEKVTNTSATCTYEHIYNVPSKQFQLRNIHILIPVAFIFQSCRSSYSDGSFSLLENNCLRVSNRQLYSHRNRLEES